MQRPVKWRVTCSIRIYPLECAKKNDENEIAASQKEIRSNQKILSILDKLNNEVAKVKVENSADLILDYGLNPLYKFKFTNYSALKNKISGVDNPYLVLEI